MPEFFEFKRADPYVVRHLTGPDIAGVRRWQSDRLDYQFSFHTQHEAGWPCYLSEPDGPGRNLPKINVRAPTTPPALLQGESVQDQAVGADFRDVIRANIPMFQTLARVYYEGDVEARVQVPGWAIAFTCTTPPLARARTVLVRLPDRARPIPEAFWANFSKFAKKPKCPTHRVNTCMGAGVAQQVPYNEFVNIALQFDENGGLPLGA